MADRYVTFKSVAASHLPVNWIHTSTQAGMALIAWPDEHRGGYSLDTLIASPWPSLTPQEAYIVVLASFTGPRNDDWRDVRDVFLLSDAEARAALVQALLSQD